MPKSAPKPCTWPGCTALSNGGRCEAHRRQVRQEHDAQRGSAHARGYSVVWRRAREGYLRKHPLCALCQVKTPAIYTPASVVDHKVPHRGDKQLFWDSDGNWQPLCKPCHDRKTATEDGGWGQSPGGGGQKADTFAAGPSLPSV